jgi:hypothetical protein
VHKSEQIGELMAALAKAQAEFRPVTKGRKAKIQTKSGASFSYDYADHADAVEQLAPILVRHGLAVVQPAERQKGGDVTVTTLLGHTSGQWISGECSWPSDATDPRSIGSAITYARRYGYLSICGAVASDEDDDGEHARGGNHEQGTKPVPRAQSKPAASLETGPLTGAPAAAWVVQYGAQLDDAKTQERFYEIVDNPTNLAAMKRLDAKWGPVAHELEERAWDRLGNDEKLARTLPPDVTKGIAYVDEHIAAKRSNGKQQAAAR